MWKLNSFARDCWIEDGETQDPYFACYHVYTTARVGGLDYEIYFQWWDDLGSTRDLQWWSERSESDTKIQLFTIAPTVTDVAMPNVDYSRSPLEPLGFRNISIDCGDGALPKIKLTQTPTKSEVIRRTSQHEVFAGMYALEVTKRFHSSIQFARDWKRSIHRTTLSGHDLLHLIGYMRFGPTVTALLLNNIDAFLPFVSVEDESNVLRLDRPKNPEEFCRPIHFVKAALAAADAISETFAQSDELYGISNDREQRLASTLHRYGLTQNENLDLACQIWKEADEKLLELNALVTPYSIGPAQRDQLVDLWNNIRAIAITNQPIPDMSQFLTNEALDPRLLFQTTGLDVVAGIGAGLTF